MIVITFSHQKGGVGKSTLSLALYSFLKKEGINVGIYDYDPQGSIRQSKEEFSEGSEDWKDLELVPIQENISDLLELDYEAMIIDTPPYLATELPIAFEISDLIIFPLKPSPFDTLAIRSSISLLEDSKVNVKSGAVLTMVDGKTSFQESVKEILGNFEIKLFETEVHQRISYSRTLLFSSSIFTSGDKKAISEIDNFGKEVLTLLENG